MLEKEFSDLQTKVNSSVERANAALASTLRDNASLNRQLGENAKTIEFAKNLVVLSLSITLLLIALRAIGW